MNESPSARTPGHSAPSRGRRLRSTSESSPTRQRNTDDLLSNLTPRTVVDAFRNPSGSLKACIEAATPAEQAFALRVAIASNTIHEWLSELSAWPWPAGGGSAGFAMPADKRKAIPGLGTSQASDQEYNGSLPSADVARYEKRIDDIAQGLEELNIEEIKSQVLNNHIMPLSRPGTPIMDSGRSAMSLSSITRLDDLTALVTATTLQALPELSRLTRLMNAWSLRLLVLRKIPVFLASVSDAEAALQSGWNALGPDGRIRSGSTGAPSAVSPLDDLEVMKSVIGQKVAKAGRDLDAMLDILEGQPDTLPEDWIDRVDTLEHGYGEWAVACDRKMKRTDLISSIVQAAPATGASVPPQHSEADRSGSSVAANRSLASDSLEREQAQVPEGERPDGAQKSDSKPDVSPPVIKIHSTTEDQAQTPEDDYPDTDSELVQSASDGSIGAGPHTVLASKPSNGHHNHGARPEDTPGSSFSSDSELSDIAGHGAPQPAQRGRRASGVSESSTVLNEAPSMFMDSFSSDLPDQGVSDSFDHGRVDQEEGPNRSLLSTRSRSVSFNDHPTVTELPSFPSPPGTPTTSTTLDDDDATEPGTPSERQMPGMDDQLQQQISEILESVPAKIRLTAEPPAVNLNPPDFKMPTGRKSSRSDAIPRSQSNGSMRSVYSRSATPSFTLAPARNSRPRHQRDNREIKVYHLSRSNGEAPIKLFIRCVGEHGERVMVRVGGGWADLGEYLKEYASHHLRRSAGAATDGKVEVKDIPRAGSVRPPDATPPSRPASAMDAHSPVSPLKVRKTRRSPTANSDEQNHQQLPAAIRPKTPLANLGRLDATPPSDASSSMRSRSSSRISWDEDDGTVALGMAGPRAKQIEMSEESRAWVESIKEKVRIASSERKPPPPSSSFSSVSSVAGAEGGAAAGGVKGLEASLMDRGDGSGRAMFGELGKVGRTKRLFRRG
ncbi:hypothetical protein VTG60DRAFT_3701 [Thermothelomyces hinnuleus]